MKKYLLPDKGEFYKANLHVHTTVSDGDMTPEEIKRIYKEKGYSVVAYTDHEVMLPHPELTDDGFIALTSTEISINERYDCDFSFVKTYHLNIYSPVENKSSFGSFDKSKIWLPHSYEYITEEQKKIGYDRYYKIDSVNKAIRIANEEGCLVSYNHPVWSMQDYSDYIDLEGLWGVELYNTGCTRNGYFDSEKPLDDLLRGGKRVYPLATDDSHKLQDCFGGFVMIKAEKFDYSTIFNALKSGDFYCSTGPEFEEIYIEKGIVKIKSSPVSFICVSTDTRLIYSQKANNTLLSEAEFDINWYLKLSESGTNECQYIRVTLMDEKGRRAFSRPYFIDEIKG